MIVRLLCVLVSCFFFATDVLYADENNKIGDDSDSLFNSELTRLALDGDGNAAFSLGRSYLLGRGVPKDDGRALWWFRRGAKSEHVESMTMVARCYAFGWGTEIDVKKALESLLKPMGKSSPLAFLTFLQILEDNPKLLTGPNVTISNIEKTRKILITSLEKIKEANDLPLLEKAVPIAKNIDVFLSDQEKIIKEFNKFNSPLPNKIRKNRHKDSLVVLSKRIKATEIAGEYVYYAWKADVLNSTGQDMKCTVKLIIKDKEGFEIDRSYSDSVKIPANDSKIISYKGMMKKSLWRPGNTIEAIPRNY